MQHDDGTLGTRFVSEMIPPWGEPVSPGNVENPTTLTAHQGREQVLFDNVPNDVRFTLTLEPQGNVSAFGLQLRTTDGQRDGSELRLTPRTTTASFSHSTHSGSGGPLASGPSIAGLRGLAGPTRLDIICRHDIVDVEVGGQHTLVNRYWNPVGNRLGIWVEGGTLLVRDVTICPLLEQGHPARSSQ